MPSCAVVVCGNRSNKVSYKTCGVTYHIFPKNPELKEKWIEATGRDDNWFPTAHSCICSSHFEEKNFLPAPKSRRLFPTAVPTLKLRLVFETPSTTSKEKIAKKKTIITSNERKTALYRSNVKLQKCMKAMKAQQLQIKRLQTMIHRCRNKVNVMKNILNALKEGNAISEDHLWLLESDVLKL